MYLVSLNFWNYAHVSILKQRLARFKSTSNPFSHVHPCIAFNTISSCIKATWISLRCCLQSDLCDTGWLERKFHQVWYCSTTLCTVDIKMVPKLFRQFWIVWNYFQILLRSKTILPSVARLVDCSFLENLVGVVAKAAFQIYRRPFAILSLLVNIELLIQRLESICLVGSSTGII